MNGRFTTSGPHAETALTGGKLPFPTPVEIDGVERDGVGIEENLVLYVCATWCVCDAYVSKQSGYFVVSILLQEGCYQSAMEVKT